LRPPQWRSGCITNESVRLQVKAQQEALIRDGNPALVSRKKNSLVLFGGRKTYSIA
jgi:hypothetical protein